jgi:hypothetical protein
MEKINSAGTWWTINSSVGADQYIWWTDLRIYFLHDIVGGAGKLYELLVVYESP